MIDQVILIVVLFHPSSSRNVKLNDHSNKRGLAEMQALFLAAFNRGMKKLGESGRYQQLLMGLEQGVYLSRNARKK